MNDLTGRTFGRLTVISFFERGKYGYKWLCKCSCGNSKIISAHNLMGGGSTSCGCYRVERLQEKVSKDLSGMKFGRLTVIRKDGKNKQGHTMYECVCDCGNKVRKEGSSMSSGHTSSCGCLQIELTIERSTTHGMTHTKIYRDYRDRKRREQRRLFDSKWTVEMECELRKFFTSCVICGSNEKLEVDHVLPLSRGNGLAPGNVVVLCHRHNQKKWSKNLSDLPDGERAIIEKSAISFKRYWENYLVTRIA
jgi:5-methylcytosine-specific restriction endonuclease McrA